MSLISVKSLRNAGCFPRVSGDEPSLIDGFVSGIKFSPRERG